MVTENMNISGERTAMRMSIMNANCTLFISVVIRVTSEAFENLSMFSKEKPCTFSNTSWRRLRAKPEEAFAQVKPAPPPHASESMAISTRMSPVLATSAMWAPALMAFTSSAVMNGISTSRNTSPTMSTSVRIAGFLNSLTLA
jgi:hypothetical protein